MRLFINWRKDTGIRIPKHGYLKSKQQQLWYTVSFEAVFQKWLVSLSVKRKDVFSRPKTRSMSYTQESYDT